MIKVIDKIILSDQAPKGKNVLWLQPTKKGYQIKVKSDDGYTTINTGSSEEHEYVDLGLPSGTLWATCNVGATKPEEYGEYFAWGETLTKDNYSNENSLTFNKEFPDISGNSQYDAARVHWGNAWRMPTKDEMLELLNSCNWEWITQKGVVGYKCTGPNGNSIFFPAAGHRDKSSLKYIGILGYYTTSTPVQGLDYSMYYFYSKNNSYSINNGNRGYGSSIRPVKSK